MVCIFSYFLIQNEKIQNLKNNKFSLKNYETTFIAGRDCIIIRVEIIRFWSKIVIFGDY